MPIDVSVVIPARNEATNLHALLPSLHRTLEAMGVSFEVIVVEGGSRDQTVQTVQALGDRVIRQSQPGYGHALKEGFQAAQGESILTMDADLSHEPSFITALWANRRAAEVVIASRYTRGGAAYMPPLRKVLSRVLNTAFAKGLSLDVRDVSSGFRLYRAAALKTVMFEGTDFDALPEILIRFRVAGWRIAEVPFTYFPRRHGSSQARIIRVGMNLAKTFVRMRRLRNSMQQTASSRFGIVMLSSKFYATSDMGGGLEQSACRLSHHLLGAGHRVVVLTRNYDGLPQREMIDGVLVHRFPIWGRSPTTVSLSYLVQSLWWLLRHRREYQIIHCHQSYAPATIGVLAKLLLGKPVLVLIATSDEFSERRELERLPLFRLRRFLLRRVDRFVALNRMARDEFKELGVEPSRIIHIANGVPIPQGRAFDASTRQAARKRLGLPWERIVIFVGRLAAEKNLPTLIEAWPLVLRVHPNAHLLLVGDGGTFRNVEPELRHQVATLGLQESVHFIGRTAEVLDLLLAADVFVLPSSTEGMSNALLEAMAAGVPIVASRVPGNCELIEEGRSGLLVEPRDHDRLAQAMIELLSSPAMAVRLAQEARRTAEERFAIQRIGLAYQALYAELTAGDH